MRILFIISEKHTITSVAKLIELTEMNKIPYKIYYCPPFSDSLKFRFIDSKYYFTSIKSDLLKMDSFWFEDCTIIFSSSEGFIVSNRYSWLPKLKNCRTVMVQHGIMPTKETNKLFRFIAHPLNILFNRKIIGSGFGGNKADLIIVYGQKYKEYLIKKKKWNPENIVVSGKLLRQFPSLDDNDTKSNDCIFLMQDLSRLIPLNLFETYCYQIVKILSEHYDNIYIRKHPKMEDGIEEWFKDINNVKYSTGSLIDDLSKVKTAFSFFSTALIEAAVLGRMVIAIILPKLDKDLYSSFNCVIDYNEMISKDISTLIDMPTINEKYFDIKSDPATIFIQNILK